MNLQQRVRTIGLIAGPVLALVAYFALPVEYADATDNAVPLGHATRATLAMMVWMATWWMTEAVEIEVTSLLPIVAFPLLGIMPLGKTTANYGADVIYLFLGGFVLALAIQRWGLDRRIAFQALKWVGTRPAAIVAGIMGATAFVSMWVSNTATAAMMVPIALSIVDLSLVRRTGQDARRARRHPAGGRGRPQSRAVAAAGRRVRGVDRRTRHDHRLAAERHLRALLRADLRRRDLVHEVDAGRDPGDAAVPAARLVPQHARAVPDADPRDRGWTRVGARRDRQARAAEPRRARDDGGVRGHRVLLGASGRCWPTSRSPASRRSPISRTR